MNQGPSANQADVLFGTGSQLFQSITYFFIQLEQIMNHLANKEGHLVPQVAFQIREGDSWQKITTDDLFKGQKVIVFALPGAFTPTCSSSHLPRYNELAGIFKDYGVDRIICLSVNDTFVMNAWQENQNAANITFIPDGNGDFSKELGMLVDKRDLGFGMRSWRYSMLVDDGEIKKMFIEPDVAGDPFEVSDADTMLQYLAPKAELPKDITIFTKPGCSFCAQAKKELAEHGYGFEEVSLGGEVSFSSIRAVTGRETVPQLFINGEHIGGGENIARWLQDNPGNH